MMQKSALVLSGGGSLGAAHIGALKVLEQKFIFDFLVGVSAGAIVAAAIACDKTAEQVSQLLQEQNFFRLAFDISKSNFGFLRGKKILHLLDKIFEERSFADIAPKKKLIIGATDFTTGERVMISSGSIAQAVRASLSVPLLFEPLYYQNRWLVDGGISQNFPLDTAIDHYKGDAILGIDVGTSLSAQNDFGTSRAFGKLTRMRSALERTFRILFFHQQKFSTDNRVKIIRPDLGQFTTLDIRKLAEIEEQGKQAAREFLE